MWQNFTERGKRVFQLAHKEALRMGHDVIGTEHILLGLLYDSDGIINRLLASYNLDHETLVGEIEQYAGSGTPHSEPVDLPMSPRAKCVMDLAMREARRMGVNYIGTEHIFLAILAEGEDLPQGCLPRMALTLKTAVPRFRSCLADFQLKKTLPRAEELKIHRTESRSPPLIPQR